jgi:beta-glucuronidase
VRFESVNYRSKIWLNGRPIGTNRGAYLPFEIRLPASAVRRGGVNRLVIRVDSRRKQTDFPPSGLSAEGRPTGGWWNYGGLLREVYLRRIDDVDVNTAVVRPTLPLCDVRGHRRLPHHDAQLRRPRAARARRRPLRRPSGSRSAAPWSARAASRPSHGASRSARPRLWSPADPELYDASFAVRSGDRVLQRYTLRTGIRSIAVSGDGRLLLNGAPLNFRGMAIHEDSR